MGSEKSESKSSRVKYACFQYLTTFQLFSQYLYNFSIFLLGEEVFNNIYNIITDQVIRSYLLVTVTENGE